MMKKKMFLLFLTFLYSGFSYADVLFIDFNNSKKEIDAARKASLARGEKLIVLPLVDRDDEVLLTQLKKELTISRSSYEKCSSNVLCDELSSKVSKIESSINSINSKYALDFEGVKKQLGRLNPDQLKLTSVVISGHDGNAQFFGERGSINELELEEAFKKCSPLGDSIRSVMLWGCYTANIGSISKSWKKMLPNIELIAGFDGVAPSGEKLASSQYLHDILIQEKKLTAIKDKNKLQEAFKSLRSVPLTNASLCTSSAFVNNRLALTQDEMNKVCGGLDYEKIKSVFYCYKNALAPKCANPPQNTSSGELRLLYNQLQETRHCWEWDAPPDFPSLDVLIRLIFFDNVKNNILKSAQNDFQKADVLLRKLNAPSELKLSDLNNLNRAQILERLTKISKFLESIIGTYNNPRFISPLAPEAKVVSDLMYGLQSSLGELLPSRIPFDWVEPVPVSKPISSFSFDEKTIQMKRMTYENDRAQYLMKSKFVEMIKNEPQYEEIKKIKNESDRLDNELAVLGRDNEIKRSEIRQKISANLNQSSQIFSKIREKHLSDLKSYKQNLQNQPYGHEEGKKVFNKALENYDVDNIFVELDDCF